MQFVWIFNQNKLYYDFIENNLLQGEELLDYVIMKDCTDLYFCVPFYCSSSEIGNQ